MPKGISLHIGLGRIDPTHYAGTSGRLDGPEYDANSMLAIAEGSGFKVERLLTTDATREHVINTIVDTASKLDAGDTFFLSYSGHGGLLPNFNNDQELTGYDQTWCLFDGMLLDDELKTLWQRYRAGVRVAVVSDSCFSGTMLELASSKTVAKYMPPSVIKATYLSHKQFYDSLLSQSNIPDTLVKASILLLSSCQDNQECLDGLYNSVFTEELVKVWNGANFNGNYEDFTVEIANQMPLSQTPKLTGIGPSNSHFMASKPFTI